MSIKTRKVCIFCYSIAGNITWTPLLMNFSITAIHSANIEVFFMSGIVLGMQSMLVNQKKI